MKTTTQIVTTTILGLQLVALATIAGIMVESRYGSAQRCIDAANYLDMSARDPSGAIANMWSKAKKDCEAGTR